jgi:hypothetical protein
MPLSPAQRLNYDVLSIIFVMSSRGSRRDTLELSSVCRLWRYIALSVPEIWSKFLVDDFSTPYILHIFLERSKPLPLHIVVPQVSGDELLEVLSTAAERIVCMTIINSCRFLQNQFPILEQLVLVMSSEADHKNRIPGLKSLSKATQFSQLRELCLISISAPPLDSILDVRGGFPGLQKLEVVCEDGSSWDTVVLNASNALVSLVLHLRPTSSVHVFSLPQLRHLRIINTGGQIELLLEFDAPCLESVEQGEGVGGAYIEIRLQNPRSVKQLCIVHDPLDLTLYPALRKLWIDCQAGYNDEILPSLRHQIALCPELEAVFYCGPSQCGEINDEEDEYSRPESVLSAIVDVVRETGRDIMVKEFCPTELELPGSMRRNVCTPLIVIRFYCHD